MITFEELDTAKSSENLVPAIIQDDTTLAVLMLGYMDREALDKTRKEGRVTFYSRSKGRLWTKGETSGNFLDVVSIAKDCDSDTLLIRVIPHGPVCHTGTVSCFASPETRKSVTEGGTEHYTEGFIRRLQQIIRRRHAEMPEGSYTSKLFNRGVNKIAQKVGEEAAKRIREYYGQRDGRRRYKAMRHDTFTGYLADLKEVRDDLSSTRLELLKKREADEAEYRQKKGDRNLSEYERAQALIRWKDREGYYSAQMERLKNQAEERIAAIRDSFAEHVKDFYTPNGYRIDSGTMQLLNSGIKLSDDELTGLVEANIHNPTMLRVLADESLEREDVFIPFELKVRSSVKAIGG